jgi:hypothetical protein
VDINTNNKDSLALEVALVLVDSRVAPVCSRIAILVELVAEDIKY